MKLEALQPRLRAFPVQLIESTTGLIVRRGCVQVVISGSDAAAVVERVFELANRGAGATEEEIAECFAGPDRASVRSLVAQLQARRILVPVDDAAQPQTSEGPLDVFFWHFGDSSLAVARRMEEKRICILGVNEVARQMASNLAASGVRRVDVVDYPLLRNLRFVGADGRVDARWGADLPNPIPFDAWVDGAEEIGVLVATSDFGGLQQMRRWNEFAFEVKCHFFPAVLQDLIGYVGPLVVPGETACYECLRARENANLSQVELARAAEESAFDGQSVAAALPSMASMVGSLAATELIRFYGRALPNPRAGSLLEVNLLTSTMAVRKVLRVPRCQVCSPLRVRSSASPEKNIFLPGNAPQE